MLKFILIIFFFAAIDAIFFKEKKQPRRRSHRSLIEELNNIDNSSIPDIDFDFDVTDESEAIEYGYYMSAKAKEKFLKSPKWKELKKQRRKIADKCCEFCYTTTGPFHLHHIDYVRLGGFEHMDDLRYLCESCHKRQHDHYGKDRLTYYLPLV